MIAFGHEIVVFDIETTDTVLGDPEIIQIAGVLLDSGLDVVQSYARYVRPQSGTEKMSAFVQELTGITPEQVLTAPQWKDVWREFAELTRWRGRRLVGYNVSFDAGVLLSEYKRLGMELPHSRQMFDVMSMAYLVLSWQGYRPENWKLGDVGKRLGVEVLEPRHNASNDCLTTVNLLKKITEYLT